MFADAKMSSESEPVLLVVVVLFPVKVIVTVDRFVSKENVPLFLTRAAADCVCCPEDWIRLSGPTACKRSTFKSKKKKKYHQN